MPISNKPLLKNKDLIDQDSCCFVKKKNVQPSVS